MITLLRNNDNEIGSYQWGIISHEQWAAGKWRDAFSDAAPLVLGYNWEESGLWEEGQWSTAGPRNKFSFVRHVGQKIDPEKTIISK